MIPWREGRHGSLATWLHAFRGGSATVAEANDNRRSKRATGAPGGGCHSTIRSGCCAGERAGAMRRRSRCSATQAQQPKCERKGRRPQEAETDAGDTSPVEPPQAALEVPTFDLAENVLAEHRQMAARRRKAPGQVQTEPEIRPERPAVVTHVIEPPSQDLAELQHVVAEIVARDIQRLCSQPSRPPRRIIASRRSEAAGELRSTRPILEGETMSHRTDARKAARGCECARGYGIREQAGHCCPASMASLALHAMALSRHWSVLRRMVPYCG